MKKLFGTLNIEYWYTRETYLGMQVMICGSLGKQEYYVIIV